MNAQGELYLTDAVRDLVEAGHRVAVHVAPDPDDPSVRICRLRLDRD